MRDLFGAESVERPDRRNLARGYAAPPGSGPEGESCRTCARAYSIDYHDKRYWKCALVKQTHGLGTDIRLKSPACSRWEGK